MGDTQGTLGSCPGLHCVSQVLSEEPEKEPLPQREGVILEPLLQVSHVQTLMVYRPLEKWLSFGTGPEPGLKPGFSLVYPNPSSLTISWETLSPRWVPLVCEAADLCVAVCFWAFSAPGICFVVTVPHCHEWSIFLTNLDLRDYKLSKLFLCKSALAISTGLCGARSQLLWSSRRIFGSHVQSIKQLRRRDILWWCDGKSSKPQTSWASSICLLGLSSVTSYKYL